MLFQQWTHWPQLYMDPIESAACSSIKTHTNNFYLDIAMIKHNISDKTNRILTDYAVE